MRTIIVLNCSYQRKSDDIFKCKYHFTKSNLLKCYSFKYKKNWLGYSEGSIKLNREVVDKIDELIEGIDNTTEGQIEKYKSKNSQINAIVGNKDRLKEIANDIVGHFEARQELFSGKGMIVCMTR